MRSILVVGALALASGAAQAADNGVFLGAAVTQTNINALTTNVDVKDTSYKLILGVRPIDSVGIEVNYLDLGHDRATLGPVAASADATAFAGYVVGYVKLPLLDIYGKIGAARWETRAQLLGGGTSLSLKDSGTDLAYGAGLQARFGSLAGRLEYERFKVGSSNGADLVSLGLTWTFL
jgi:hypothetical protein